jgi:uncharacterized RDD family membrane protein YckC
MSLVTPLPPTPTLRRRMAAFVYEGVLLFGVLMAAGLVFATLTQQRHALQNREAGMAFLFVVLGLYFVWFWSHSGQTLAMKTWLIRLVSVDGGPVSRTRSLARYLSSFVWFLPPLAAASLIGLPRLGNGGVSLLLLLWIVGYAAAALLHPQRQFWHDALCGTRIVSAPKSIATDRR